MTQSAAVQNGQTAVLVGGGVTSARAVAGLRDAGFAGRIVLICDEPQPAYDWMVLTGDYLSGDVGDALVDTDGAEVRTSVRAEGLDREAKVVTLSDGEKLPYDVLLLATGTGEETVALPGRVEACEAGLLHTLDSYEHVTSLRTALKRGGRVVVAGDGWAAHAAVTAARRWGAHVTLLSQGSAPLHRILGPEGGSILADLHRDKGVDVRIGTKAAEVRPGSGVRTAAGEWLAANVVVIAPATVPEVTLARTAGLDVADGVIVDDSCRTSDPSVFAAGSASSVAFAGGRIRPEGWTAAAEQGYVAGRVMAGESATWAAAPHFSLTPYGAEVEFWGWLGGGYDQVVFRGEDEGEDDESLEEFSTFWLRGGSVVAAMSVDTQEAGVAALVGAPRVIEGERLADLGTPLNALR